MNIHLRPRISRFRIALMAMMTINNVFTSVAMAESETEYGDADLTPRKHQSDGFGRFNITTPAAKPVKKTGSSGSERSSTLGKVGHTGKYAYDPLDFPENVRPLVSEAEALRVQNNFPAALQCYEKALKISPDCLPVRQRRGTARLKLKNYKEALDDLNFVLSKEPKNTRALMSRSRCYQEVGDLNRALDDLNTLVAINPTLGPTRMRRSELLENLGKQDEAAKEKAIAVDLIAKDKVAALSASGHYVEALAVVNEGLKLEPTNRWLMASKGELLCNMRMYKEALQAYDKLGSKVSADTSYMHGRALEGSGATEKAIAQYSIAIADGGKFSAKTGDAEREKQTKLAQYYHDRARANIKKEAYAAAIKDCSAYLPYCPEADGYSLRADAYTMSGNLKDALADYKSATKINPKMQHALLEGAHVAEKISDNPSAIAFYTSLIEINPKLSDFYLSRAKLYEKSKKFAEAEGDLNMCIKLQPNDTLGYESRGSLRASMHRNAEALTDYTAAIALEPDSSILYVKRAAVYEALGNTPLAAADKKTAEHKKSK